MKKGNFKRENKKNKNKLKRPIALKCPNILTVMPALMHKRNIKVKIVWGKILLPWIEPKQLFYQQKIPN